MGELSSSGRGIGRRFLASVAVLLIGAGVGLAPSAFADIESTITQEGDNDADVEQDGAANSGDAVVGQVAGVSSSGDVSIDARNRVNDADAKSGDAEGTNSVTSFTGNQVLGGEGCPAPTTELEAAQRCPEEAGVVGAGIETDDLISVIVHDGDNTQSIDQSADVNSGDAVAGGQVIGAVGAGIIDIVLDNMAEDVEATSGDAEANNVIDEAEASNLVTFQECPCPIPGLFAAGIEASTITATIVHDGDNDQSIDQAANAESGDAVSGSQVVGAVAAVTGEISIDGRNRAEDTEATSGDADANNTIELAASGNVVLDQPTGCCPPSSDATLLTAGIEANEIDAVIVHEGDNEQEIGQAADAVSGDAVSGAQIVGAVGGGAIDIVVDNRGEDSESTSGDAAAENTIEDAEASNLVTFAPGCPCPIPGDIGADIDATTITAVILHEGDNTQSIDQAADASSGDAVSAAQVVGAVSAVGGNVSIDATNRGEDSEATTGDADATNTIGLAASGNAVLDCCGDFLTLLGPGAINAVNHQEGDNDQDIVQAADAVSGDAVAGAQVIGAIGGNVEAVLENFGRDVELDTGDAETDNTIDDSEVGLVVVFPLVSSNVATVAISDLLMMGLTLLAGMRFAVRPVRRARRRKRPVPPTDGAHAVEADVLETSGSADAEAGPTEGSPRSVSTTEVLLATLVVLGGFVLARRLGRK